MQIAFGFFLGFCTSVMIGIISQRAGTVGGEILLLPMMIGIAVMMYRVGRDCR
ncbi:MAG: hypothetical protein RR420_05390 [Anaerovoracaceae bacterium]